MGFYPTLVDLPYDDSLIPLRRMGCKMATGSGLELYARRMIERIRDAIEPDTAQGEPPLLPILNRYKPIGTSKEVDFRTVRPCRATVHSHVNQVVVDAPQWESTAAFQLEQLAVRGLISHYLRNDHLGLLIPYEYLGLEHSYEPDFVVCLSEGRYLLLEIKGQEDEQDRAKHEAAKKWVRAVNHWGQLGTWQFHVCKTPQQLVVELRRFFSPAPVGV